MGNEALWELPVNACYRQHFTCNRDVIMRVRITAALCARDAMVWFLEGSESVVKDDLMKIARRYRSRTAVTRVRET